MNQKSSFIQIFKSVQRLLTSGSLEIASYVVGQENGVLEVELIEEHRPIQLAEGIHVWDVDPYSEPILQILMVLSPESCLRRAGWSRSV